MRAPFQDLPAPRKALVLMAVLALSVACSSEPDGPDRPIDRVEDVGADADADDLDSGQPDSDVSDTGDADDDVDQADSDESEPDADADEADADEPDTDADEPDGGEADADVPLTPCEEATIDLGMLQVGSNLVEIAADHPAVSTAGVCDGAFGADHVIVRFELPEDGSIRVNAPGLAVTFSPNPCSTLNAICIRDLVPHNAIAGSAFYAAIERPDVDTTVDIVFEALEACEPEGEMACVDGQEIRACTTGFRSMQIPIWVTLPCPAGCESDACVGNSCQNPIVVNGSVTVQSFGETLSNTFDNQGAPSCIWDTPSVGRELIFRIDDVEIGDVIEVTIHDPFRYYRVSIMQSCSDSAECLDSRVPGSVFEYVVEQPGSHFLVVDSEFDVPSSPEISIELK